MAACGVCTSKVDRNDQEKLVCNVCFKYFHAGCVKINNADFEFMKSKDFPWKCNECLSARKSLNSHTPNKNSPSHHNALDISSIKSNTNTEAISLSSPKIPIETPTLDSINKNIQLLSKTIDDIKLDLLKEIKNEIRNITKNLMGEISELKKENESLQLEIKNINNKLDMQDQLSLNDCIDIVGLPFIENDKLMSTVQQIFSENLNVNVNNEKIAYCYQKKIINSNSPSKTQIEPKFNNIIKVKFNCSEIKNKIMKSKRNLRNKTLSVCNNKNEKVNNILCFINHALTTKRRKLYKDALIVKKNYNVKFLWIKNGVILMRKDENSMKKIILDTLDLDSFKN